MTTIFSIILLTLQNDFHAFKINSSDILLHFSSVAALSEPIFGCAFYFLIDVVGSFLIAVARAVEKPSFRFSFNTPLPIFL